MRIGILTYSSAINFGANLQAFSTFNYLKKKGYEPIFIDYSPSDFNESYSSYPKDQIQEHIKFFQNYTKTPHCSNAKEVAEILKKENIQNVIIGSDAVAQHHPLISQIVFPSKKIISISKPTSDRMFPNPYWGEFLNYTPDINVCLMSVSSQQSKFKSFSLNTVNEMMNIIQKFSYISVRDEWTKNMYRHISKGKICPEVTPDPVFAFNQNCAEFIPSKESILEKFNLPEKYIILSIRKGKSISSKWATEFEKVCIEHGYTCIGLPFPYGFTNLNKVKIKIELPLSPIEWYALIKYSSGYVGHNMHTIVSALHNAVPCYSFDQYGRRFFMQWCDDSSSKIYDILCRAGFPKARVVSGTIIDRTPKAEEVFKNLMDFDIDKCKSFAAMYQAKYNEMMNNIEKTFKK